MCERKKWCDDDTEERNTLIPKHTSIKYLRTLPPRDTWGKEVPQLQKKEPTLDPSPIKDIKSKTYESVYVRLLFIQLQNWSLSLEL